VKFKVQVAKRTVTRDDKKAVLNSLTNELAILYYSERKRNDIQLQICCFLADVSEQL